MSSGPTDLFDLAVALLNATVDAFTTDGVSLPSVRYVTGVEPIAQCDSLVVSWTGVWVGSAGSAEVVVPLKTNSTRVGGLTIHIFRCVPALQGEGLELVNLDYDALQTSAAEIMTDAYVLHRGIARAHFKGTFGSYCSGLSLGKAEPIPVGGGIAGVLMPVTAELS